MLLRHDIDFDLDKALRIAEIENKFGVNSTYFFLANSEFYNILHFNNTKKILRILAMGNRISIHFDISNYPQSDDEELTHHLSKEISYFKDLFGVDINIVSFHRPDENALMDKLNFNVCHTYMAKFSELIKYISDSMKCMKEGDLIEIVSSQKYKQIQLLIHPFWWNHNYTNPKVDYDSFIEKKLNSLIIEISNNSKIFIRE